MSNQTASDKQVVPFTSFAGMTLEEALQREPAPWPAEQVLALLQNIASVVSGLHAQGGVHGSLNPRNVHFEANGRAVLDNFGQYRAATQPPLDRLAARYYTPEQALGGEPNAQSDIYSLGILSFELLTGTPLFDDEEPDKILYQHRTAPLRFACAIRPELKPEVDRVLVRALARDPRQRFHLVKHLVEGLARALEPSENPEARTLPQNANAATQPKMSHPLTTAATSDLASDISGAGGQYQTPQPLAQPLLNAQPAVASQDTSTPSVPDANAPKVSTPVANVPEVPQEVAQTPLVQVPLLQTPSTHTPASQVPSQAPAAQRLEQTPAPNPVQAPQQASSKNSLQGEAATPLQSLQAQPLIPPARKDENRPGTEIWTPPEPPPPPAPPQKRNFLSGIIAIAVVGLMMVGIWMQPAPPVQKSDPQEIARLRAEYLEARPPKLLPFPDEAKKTGILKKVLLTDYMSLLVEQYKGMYLGLFTELQNAKKKAEGAEREAKRLQSEVKTAKKNMDARADVLQRQLSVAQAEAARAQAAVNSAKRSVDAANQKMSYFQGEYTRIKSSMPPVAP